MKWRFIGIITLLFFALSACSNSTETIDPTPTSGPMAETSGAGVSSATRVAEENSPIATPEVLEVAQASPIATPGTLVEVPTPSSSDQGTVTGILILDNDGEHPVSEAILYLGEIILAPESNLPTLAGLDRQNAPAALTEATGQFIFENVPPGNYALILDRVVNSFVLQAPTGEDMIIQVEAGEIVDLGELRYGDLPIN